MSSADYGVIFLFERIFNAGNSPMGIIERQTNWTSFRNDLSDSVNCRITFKPFVDQIFSDNKYFQIIYSL